MTKYSSAIQQHYHTMTYPLLSYTVLTDHPISGQQCWKATHLLPAPAKSSPEQHALSTGTGDSLAQAG